MVLAIDPGSLHVGRQIGGIGLPLADARSGVDHDVFVADLEHHHGQRDRHEFGGQAGLGKRLLGVLDRGILDEGRIVRLAPDPVIDGGHLDRADLVFVDAVGRLERSLGVGGTDESELLAVQAECRGDRSGSQDTPARHDKHRRSPNFRSNEANCTECAMASIRETLAADALFSIRQRFLWVGNGRFAGDGNPVGLAKIFLQSQE